MIKYRILYQEPQGRQTDHILNFRCFDTVAEANEALDNHINSFIERYYKKSKRDGYHRVSYYSSEIILERLGIIFEEDYDVDLYLLVAKDRIYKALIQDYRIEAFDPLNDDDGYG